MTGATAVSPSLPAASASAAAASTSAVEAAVTMAAAASARSEIDRLDELVEMASLSNTNNNAHGSSNASGSAPGAVPTPTIAGGVSGGTTGSSGGNTSPFLMPRNPRDTVLTSGSPKRRIAAVNASQQQQAHHLGIGTSRGQQQRGIASGSGIGIASGMVPPPPPPPPPPPVQPASARSTPTNASSNYRTHQPNAKPQSHHATHSHSHSHIILPPSMHAQSRNPSDPDAEEQVMFESRLCEDEYGVAVRKINHNGKSQLRYVKCVWLPSSEMVLDALGVNGIGGGISASESYSHGGSPAKRKNSAAGGNAASTTASMNSVTTGGNGGHGSSNRRGRGRARSNTASGGNSVSSLMGRMVSAGRSRGRSLSRDPSVRMNGRRNGGGGGGIPSSSASSLSQNGADNGPPKVVVEGPISSPGMAVHDDERDEDEARLLETRQASLPLGLGDVGDVDPAAMSTKQMRALTWGNKKKVRIPLNRFVCVRKGKTTDRTKRNGHSASRLLSLITDDPANPSLDIEAPTKLDRDKFAKAFARFLEVPLAAEEGSKGSGSGKQRRSAAAATVANGRVGKFCRKRFSSCLRVLLSWFWS